MGLPPVSRGGAAARGKDEGCGGKLVGVKGMGRRGGALLLSDSIKHKRKEGEGLGGEK